MHFSVAEMYIAIVFWFWLYIYNHNHNHNQIPQENCIFMFLNPKVMIWILIAQHTYLILQLLFDKIKFVKHLKKVYFILYIFNILKFKLLEKYPDIIYTPWWCKNIYVYKISLHRNICIYIDRYFFSEIKCAVHVNKPMSLN